MYNIAIIPARGGSKGIPKKNIIDFCGKPLLAWTILQSKASSLLNEVYVSTDSDEISQIAESYGASVIKRPTEISGDNATSEQALTHALEHLYKKQSQPIDYVIFLQATSPLRETKDINSAIQTIIDKKADSLFSAAQLGDFLIWSNDQQGLKSLNYDHQNRKRRQDFGQQLVENGSIYVFKPEILKSLGNRLGGKIAYSLMELWKSFEIDDQEGLLFCQELFALKLKPKI
ncbi:MAG: acylneuraminate cytidylyltransferase family protein [bacterium]|nr:acylneuraminate cytidylyltransferase family protein [bacterium]